MELKQLLDENQIHELSDIKFDSRLLFAFMQERKTGRKYVDFTYKKFHREVVDHFTRLGDDADITYHTDQEFDKRSIPDYAILGRVEVVHFLSRRYDDVDTLLFKFIKRLEFRVLEQQAELINMRKVVALLRERHADSPATNAFLLGITSELAGWHVTKATLVAVTQDSTGYAYERGKEFAIAYGHRILPDESPIEFYARVQTDLDLEFVGAKPVPTRNAP